MAANRKVDDAGKINVYQNIAMEVSAVGGKKNKKKGGKWYVLNHNFNY